MDEAFDAIFLMVPRRLNWEEFYVSTYDQFRGVG